MQNCTLLSVSILTLQCIQNKLCTHSKDIPEPLLIWMHSIPCSSSTVRNRSCDVFQWEQVPPVLVHKDVAGYLIDDAHSWPCAVIFSFAGNGWHFHQDSHWPFGFITESSTELIVVSLRFPLEMRANLRKGIKPHFPNRPKVIHHHLRRLRFILILLRCPELVFSLPNNLEFSWVHFIY